MVRYYSLLLLALVRCAHAAPFVPALAIASPAANAVVAGPVNFTSNAQKLPSVDSVEYLLDGKRFSSPVKFPFALAWHTAYAFNGTYTIQAIGRDSSVREIARSAIVTFFIVNSPGDIRLTTPRFTTTPVKGVVVVAAEISLAPGRQLERAVLAVDGKLGAPFYSTSISSQIDTSQLRNGAHEVTIEAFDGITSQSGAAFLRMPFWTDNGHSLQEVRTSFRSLFLRPGGGAQLTARAVYTDGQEEVISSGVSYSSNNRFVTVDAGGKVSALASSMAHITVAALGKTTDVRVSVDDLTGFPHLAKGGAILNNYDPDSSLFLRTLFFLDPAQALARSPGLAAQVQQAGVNCLTTGLYYNPDGQNLDFAHWKANFDSAWVQTAKAAQDNGFCLFFTGDDISRTAPEMNNSLTGPYSAQAIQYALTVVRDSGLAVAMDMTDEISFLWGDTPTPTDNRWATRTPPIPNSAFTQLMKIMNAVPNRMPISWPVAGAHGGAIARNWFAPAFSDYASHFWTLTDNRTVYPWDSSLNQYRANMDQTIEDRLAVTDRTKPLILLTTVAGNGYMKNGPGTAFVPGQDTILADGPTPLNVTTQIMYAVAKGFSGVRAYAYDTPAWRDERAKSPNGTRGLQTGIDPFGAGQDRWQALSAAFNLIQRIEPDLLQAQVNAVDLGPDLLTGARSGTNSRVLIAVNFSEATHVETVDLQPYLNGGARIERYRVRGTDLITDTIPASSKIQESFEPGDTVIWIFRAEANPPAIPATPAITPAGGNFPAPLAIALTCATQGVDIHYSLDGTDPSLSSPLYSGGLSLSASATVKAKAFLGTTPSATAVAMFVIAAPPTPPVGADTGSTDLPDVLWRLNDGSGSAASDASGNGVTLSLFNAPTWIGQAGCRASGCLGFDGRADYASATVDLSGTSVITVAFWLYWNQFAEDDALIMELGSQPFGFNSSITGFMIDPNSSQGVRKFEVGLKGDVGYNQIMFDRPTAAAWHHYAFIFDKSAPADSVITPYIDGAPVAYTKLTNSLNTNGFDKNSLFLMSRLGSGLFASGKLADVRIYKRSLTASEVSLLAAQ